jgi:hypothetical protein
MHMSAGAALREVHAAAALEGVALLPVKGVVTGLTLYDDVSERPIADVDVRIRPRDFPALVHAMRRFTRLRLSRSYGNLVLDVDGVAIDFETSIGPPGLSGLRVDAMLERAGVLRHPLGFEMRAPDLHDHALVLCVNAFKDKIVHAGRHSLEDLSRIVRTPTFDPNRFVACAVSSQSVTLAFVVAEHFARRSQLGDPRATASSAWSAIARLLAPHVSRTAYAGLLSELVARGDPLPNVLRVLARLGHDAPTMRAIAVLRMLSFPLEQALRGAVERR